MEQDSSSGGIWVKNEDAATASISILSNGGPPVKNAYRCVAAVVFLLSPVAAAAGSPAEFAAKLEGEARLQFVKGTPPMAIAMYSIVIRLDPHRAMLTRRGGAPT